MKITRRNAVLCLLWVVLVISLQIYVFRTIFNYEHLCLWTEKFCGFFKKSNNSKTMETTKEEMVRILRKLQDLQMWLYRIDSVVKLEIYTSPQNKGYIYCLAFCDDNISKANFFAGFSNYCSLNDNKKELGSFIEHITELEYECRKSETNRTPT